MLRYAVLCLSLLVQVSWGQVVPMTNDECTSAIAVTNGTNPSAPSGLSGNFFTNAGATQGFIFPICISGTAFDVWFSYVATATGTVTVTTCPPAGFNQGTLNDTVLTVLDGSACPPTVMLGCDDDSCAFWSSVTAPVTAGATYFIRVSGLFGSTGTFYVNVTPPATPITNDECSSPVALSLGQNDPYSNSTATNSPGVAANCAAFSSPGYRDVWFSFTPACSGTLNVNTGCNGFDTILTAYTSCGGPQIACNDDATGCGLSSAISFAVTAGTPYLIRIASWSPTNSGSFPVNVAFGGGLTLSFTSPFGPGSIQIDVTGGPALGAYFLAATFFAGAYPNGWLFGLDLPLAELQALLNTGAPFLGSLGSCGQHTIGPFSGAGFLSGIPIYAIALVLPSGSPVPTVHSPPVTYTVP